MTTDIERNVPSQLLSLRRRMLDATAWLLLGGGFGMALRFATNLLTTRLLAPEMFGVVSIATVILLGLAMFSDLGLKQCIVQSRRGSDPEFLNTAWSVQCLQGVLTSLVALAISVAIFGLDQLEVLPKGSVYSDPRFPFVIAGMSLAGIISGLSSTKLYEASRRLVVGRIAQLELLSQIFGALCLVVSAAAWRSIWALVIGAIATYTMRTILSHVWLPGTPNRWKWNKAALGEILHIGRWIFTSSVMGFLVNNGDRLLLGGLLDAHQLGVYAIAYLIFNSVEQIWSTIISEVVYPALSETVRERAGQAAKSFYRVYSLVASGVYLSAGALMVAGGTLVRLLYDARYADASWMLPLLSIALISIPPRAAIYYLLAHGQAAIFSAVLAVRLATSFVAIPLGFHLFGLPGALGGLVLSQFASVPLIFYFSARAGLFDVRRELVTLPMIGVGMGAGLLVNWGIGLLK